MAALIQSSNDIPAISGPQSSDVAPAVRKGFFRTSPFIVLGEGLAAGMDDFALSSDSQNTSFPAQMALQMEIPFVQPLFQPPGVGHCIGFPQWPVVVPSPLQSTVFEQLQLGPLSNLSVPNFSVSDCVRTRPQQPLIDRNSSDQTTLNLILGMGQVMKGSHQALATQLELALSCTPALALVELGYAEALGCSVGAPRQSLPCAQSFANDYSKIVRELRQAGAEVVVMTIPSATDTAHFSTLDTAASLLKLDSKLLLEFWALQPDDLISVQGLNEIAFQLNAASVAPAIKEPFTLLPDGAVFSADAANEMQAGIRRMNQIIQDVAKEYGAVVCDLYSLIKRVSNTGIFAGERRLTSEYLGGFYSLNGYYPGATGHAVIANEVLICLNREFGATFPLIRLDSVISSDPVAGYKKAEGRNWTREEVIRPQPLPLPSAAAQKSPRDEAERASPAMDGLALGESTHVLRLPPGLRQVLPLNPEASYFGDAISAQNCRTPQTIQWGSGNNLLFGGLAMMDSHISGNLLIEFTPPDGEWTDFRVSFEGGLAGLDSTLAAPTFYKLPGKQQRINDVPGHVSGGRLNLRTGEVDSAPGALNLYANFFNSALFALLSVNPNFPKSPLSLPGQYGSAIAKFEQRADGMLDFTFHGSTFVPLGDRTAFPLNFCGPERQYASVPANGTVLHPHIALTTKDSSPTSNDVSCPSIPFNTLQEFTLFTAASSFGDLFTLDAAETGGPALGRSRLMGRLQIQFGPRADNSVPVAVSASPSGGVLAPMGRTPLTQLFPGRLMPGPTGFFEDLRFPLQTYSLNDLAVIEDPFDLCVGALDLRTGRLIHPLLHRGFINQDLLFALLRVEPRTPTSSFFFRGEGSLCHGYPGEMVFNFFGDVHIPYPPGFLFPDLNMATGFSVTGGGALDPYLWLLAVKHDTCSLHATAQGRRLVSSRGEIFSYSFNLPGDPNEERASFEYENHSQQGAFRMQSLTWIDSGESMLDGKLYRLCTFSGFGVWTKNGVERVTPVAVQYAKSAEVSYIGIQIGSGGVISNANIVSPPAAFPVPLPGASILGRPLEDTNTNLKRENSPMFSHIIELTAKPGQGRLLVAAIRDQAIPQIIRPSKGFVDQIVLAAESDPNHITAISFWNTKEDGNLFFETGFDQVSALTAPYLAQKPRRRECAVEASTNSHISGR